MRESELEWLGVSREEYEKWQHEVSQGYTALGLKDWAEDERVQEV